jgi:hypothetical protein
MRDDKCQACNVAILPDEVLCDSCADERNVMNAPKVWRDGVEVERGSREHDTLLAVVFDLA